MFGKEKIRGCGLRDSALRQRKFLHDEQLRQKAVEALHDDGQAFAHVFDGLSDLLAFMLAFAFGIFSSAPIACESVDCEEPTANSRRTV